jgi:tetratricopeptide (TPR) repeat protein
MLAVIVMAASAQTPFELGVEAFKRGDYTEAVAPLEAARAVDPRDADTALLLGICYFHLGRLDDARPLLEQAERDGDDDGKASARVFLGLVADARGEATRARDYYALVARSPTELGASGRLLLEENGPERWSLVAIAAPGYDSNVALQPTTAAPSGPGRGKASTGDGYGSLIGAITARPVPELALVVDETLSYRRYAQQTAYDLLANAVGASYALAGVENRAALAYHFDASTLGGARYELAHIAEASYRHALSRCYALGARYTFAARDYSQAAYAGYTGLDHTGGVELAWGSPRAPSEGWAGYVFERESTSDPALASTGHGGRAQISARLGGDALLRASGLAMYRTYDAASMARVDTLVRGDLAVYLGVSDAIGLILGTSLARNISNDANFDYTKWTVFVGAVAGASPR